MKTILMVHGDKGGVGKSTFASLTANFMLWKFGRVAVVEDDATAGDVGAHFLNSENVSIIRGDLTRTDMSEEAAVRLFSLIVQNANLPYHIVINTQLLPVVLYICRRI
jgi:MinD-like ATPase involved in chromosome partitioning or flagellar assembly